MRFSCAAYRSSFAPALALCATLLAARPATAVSFVLSERQQTEAVRVGVESTTRDSVGSEWTMMGEAGEAAVMTPFHRLAVAARQAAFRGRSLAAADIQQVLKEDRERLVFWVSLWGPSADFARFYQPVIVVAAHEVKAAWVQNERTAARQPDGRYLARCVYAFATARLEPTARGILSVRGQDGKEVAAFGFDLAAMR
jgi:hypothetical protein